jgi:NAD(P)-dependent dehydrogenase (short-subunit alcohol dehydrogenase family)
MVQSMIDTSDNPERTRDKLERQIPLGVIGEPDDVAHMIVYLASEESKFVTGAEFVVDGGVTAQ